MNVSSKRAEHLALTALTLSVLFFIFTWVMSLWNQSPVLEALSWQILAGALTWFVLVVQFHQRSLAEREKLDMAQLRRGRESETIFQADAAQAEMFAVAGKRLSVLEKWFVPIFAVLIAIYEMGIGLYLVYRVPAFGAEDVIRPQLVAVFMAVIAFVSFLISRYATGMSAQIEWRPLRAGGSVLLCTAMMAFAAAISLALAQFKIYQGLLALNWAIPIILVLLGVETIVNAVLDIYRPRVAGQYSRAAFDSRLLGMFGEPGGIFHTVAHTIDYQFGFKVSQTWFYQLLERAILPLAIFAAGVLYLLSCFIVVRPDEQAIVEHFGCPVKQLDGGYNIAPGLHLKMPWPIDKAYKYSTETIGQINVGFVEGEKDKLGTRPLLWGEEHFDQEFDILVATKGEGVRTDGGDVPVSIIRAAVPIHYRVKDLYSFLYNYQYNYPRGSKIAEAEKTLEALCYRELVRFAASAKIETEGDDEPGTGQLSILGAGRGSAAEYLRGRIQAEADKAGLGIEIILVNLQGIHPPPKVTPAYQNVIAAIQQKQAAILQAQAERNKVLATLCGSVERADELLELASQYSRLKNSDDPQKERLLKSARARFEELAQGDVFERLREAESYSFERIELAKATGRRFQSQVEAERKSPKGFYKRLQLLLMLEEVLGQVRKYVVVADEADEVVVEIDLTENLLTDLYDMSLLGGEE